MGRRMLESSDDRLKIIRDITQVTPYYNNPTMLKQHIENWDTYPDEVLNHLRIIIVDDGSADGKRAVEVIVHANQRIRDRIRLFTVLDDIPWNQHGARNLGAKKAGTDWLWVADMDRIVLYPFMRMAMAAELEQRPYASRGMDRRKYLSRVDPPKMTNQFFVPRKVYWDALGYDEWYCGTYGGDFEFIQEMELVSKPMIYLPGVYHFRYSRHVVEDSTTDLDRDEYWRPHVRKAREKKEAGKRQMIKPINFPWEEVQV